MDILQKIFDPDSNVLDTLWGMYLIYIPLGLLFGGSFIAILFLLHTALVGVISAHHFVLGIKSFVQWMELMLETKAEE